MSLNEKTFRITGPLWGESTCYRSPHKGPVMLSFGVSFDVSLNALLDKQSAAELRCHGVTVCRLNAITMFIVNHHRRANAAIQETFWPAAWLEHWAYAILVMWRGCDLTHTFHFVGHSPFYNIRLVVVYVTVEVWYFVCHMIYWCYWLNAAINTLTHLHPEQNDRDLTDDIFKSIILL